MRTTYLSFALPDIDEAELEEICESLLSGWLTMGPKTLQFEEVFADAVGARMPSRSIRARRRCTWRSKPSDSSRVTK